MELGFKGGSKEAAATEVNVGLTGAQSKLKMKKTLQWLGGGMNTIKLITIIKSKVKVKLLL
jgi:hypothetical protein